MAVQMPPLLKDSTGQEIKQAIQGLTPVIPDFISDAFSVERSYSKGDITIYNNNVYEFTANKSAGAWDSTKVTQTTIGAVCTSLSNSLTNKQINYSSGVNITSYNSSSNTYSIPKRGYVAVEVQVSGTSNTGYNVYINGSNRGGWINATAKMLFYYPVSTGDICYFNCQSSVTLSCTYYPYEQSTFIALNQKEKP